MEYPLAQLTHIAFPQRLLEIPQPPKELWVRGALPKKDLKWLAVVGSRKYSQYGKDACEHLISGLRGYPIVIVSGLALGMDAIAHKAALNAVLPTVAVPGSGLDWNVLYPKSNQSIAKDILSAGGALLSEYAPNTPASPWTFPQRNRIMVGLSHAVLLVEAGERSGTLITARLTHEYNRDLLAVPGSIFSEGSRGVHQFLKLGATPITSPEDILSALDIAPREKESVASILKGDEKRVFELLEKPIERDVLIRTLALPAYEANSLLALMEIQGHIVESNNVLRRA